MKQEFDSRVKEVLRQCKCLNDLLESRDVREYVSEAYLDMKKKFALLQDFWMDLEPRLRPEELEAISRSFKDIQDHVEETGNNAKDHLDEYNGEVKAKFSEPTPRRNRFAVLEDSNSPERETALLVEQMKRDNKQKMKDLSAQNQRDNEQKMKDLSAQNQRDLQRLIDRGRKSTPSSVLDNTENVMDRAPNNDGAHGIYHVNANLDQVLKELAVSNAMLARSCGLPEIKVGVFDGNILEYLAWETSFDALIQSKTCNVHELLNYLESHLSGEPKEMIKGLLLLQSRDAYEKARKRLKNRYGNDNVVGNAFLNRLSSWPKINVKDGIDLRKVADFLDQIAAAEQKIPALGVLNYAIENNKIIGKLPQFLRGKWRDEVYKWRNRYGEASYPPLKEVAGFVDVCAEKINIPELDDLDSPNDKGKIGTPEVVSNRDSYKGKFKVTSFSTECQDDTSVTRTKCYFCEEPHHIDDCEGFGKLSHIDKREFIMKRGLCFGCGSSQDHMAKDCTARITCRICKRRHLTSLHVKLDEVDSKCTQVCSKEGRKGESANVSGNTDSPVCPTPPDQQTKKLLQKNNFTTTATCDTSSCIIKCRKNFTINDETNEHELTCTDGSWNKNIPKCEAKKCVLKFVHRSKNYMRRRCPERTIGKRCRLNCTRGYQIDATSNTWVASCASNSNYTAEWNVAIAPACQPMTCKAIPAGPYVVDASCNVSLNGLCPVSCKHGFKFTSPWSMQNDVTANCLLSSDNLSAVWKSDLFGQSNQRLPIPACEEIKCPRKELTSKYKPSFCSEGSINEQCRLQCSKGYRFRGGQPVNPVISCTLEESTKTASWSVPECIKVKCAQLRTAAWRNYRDDKCSERSVGTNCHLTCKDGYRTNSPTTGHARCVLSNSGTTASWNFDDAPTCEEIKCIRKELTSNYQPTFCPEGSINDQCQLQCSKGYRFRASQPVNPVISCTLEESTKTASWSVPECIEVKCAQLRTPTLRNYRDEKCSERSVGTNCPLTCKDGYRTNSPTTGHARCVLSNSGTTASWNFDDAPTCEEIKCPRKELTRKYQPAYCPEGSINERCQLQCSKGYKFRDKPVTRVIVCTLEESTKTASWSVPGCIRVSCAQMRIPARKNYREEECSQKNVGGNCSLTCKHGYRPNSLKTGPAKCVISERGTGGSWNFDDAPTCEEVTCAQVRIPEQKNYREEKCFKKSVETVCPLTCRDGYRTNSSKTGPARCVLSDRGTTASWNFDDAPTCEEVKCPQVHIPEQKNYHEKKCFIKSVGTVCPLTCRDGYRTKSSKTGPARCVISNTGTTASWNFDDAPTCEEIKCPRKKLTDNYRTTFCPEGTINERCRLQCSKGYKFKGKPVKQDILCTLDESTKTASWPVPECVKVTCQPIKAASFDAIKNRYKQKQPKIAEECELGEVCELSCVAGYRFSNGDGVMNLTCDTENGAWNSDPADIGLCEPIIENRDRERCQYWFSGTPAKSQIDAMRQCKGVFGKAGILAMPKRSAWISPEQLPRLVGANVTGYWDDGAEIKDMQKGGAGICVSLNKAKRVVRSRCSSMFMCESPTKGSNPCLDSDNCSGNGECTPVGCSFRCQCQDLFFGDECEKGPFTIVIMDLENGSYKIYVRNNANKYSALFHFLVNGKEEWNMTLNPESSNRSFYNDLKKGEHETYLSVKASLNGRSEVVYSCKRIPGRLNLVSITNDPCNGTVLNVFWPGFINNPDSSMTYSVLVNNQMKGTAQAGEWLKIVKLGRGTAYSIKVIPKILWCDKFYKTTFSTSEGPPDKSVVSAPKRSSGTRNCAINWTLDREENTGGYKVKIIEYVGSAKMINGNERMIDLSRVTNKYNFTTRPNSRYRISVGTEALSQCQDVPLNWSKTVTGCVTGTSGPDEIAVPILEDDMSSVTLKQADERNGPISCYFVIIKVLNASMNSSEVITSIDVLKQANSTIEAGDSYIAFAARRFDGELKLQFGGGNITCCNISDPNGICKSLPERKRKKRATQNSDVVYGENLPLNPDFSYRHYVLVSTPNSDGGNPILTASPLSASWSVPGNSDNAFSTAGIALIAVAIILIMVLVVVGFLVYRRRSSNAKMFRMEPRGDPESLSIEPGEYIDLPENPESIINRELAGYAIRLNDLFRTMNTKRENEDLEFLEEFKGALPRAIKQCHLTHDIATLRVNLPKNRYKNIIPYDRSRVVLESIHGVEFSDYINASYVDGYSQRRKFIATQGPKPETTNDFWRMICEQNCRVIVMLTRLKERMKVKCAQYWPDEADTYDDITVKLQETVCLGDFVQRRMTVTRSDETFDVTQFQFIAWPDHGIPTVTSSVLRFHEYVIASQPPDAGPIVVHCSAGVGRTGTFIALNHLFDEIMDSEEINIAVIVGKMRTRRPDMVQTLEQYIFIHKLVLELYQFRASDKDVSEFNAAVRDWKSGDSNVVSMDVEFAQLDYFLPLDTDQDYAHKECNQQFNHDPAILPYNHNLVFVQMQPNDKQTPYYNGSSVMSYSASNRYIAAQNPRENSFDLFWRMVLDNDVDAIVALGQEGESDMHSYWPKVSTTEKYGIATVRTLDETKDKGLTERTFEVSHKSKKIVVSQISYEGWPKNQAPSKAGAILEIISKIEKCYQALSEQETRTTVVHCSDGSGRTGTFCAISNLIERLKNENRVDVFRTAKDLRDLRPGMIGTKEQYEFCYQAVSEYLQLFDLYGNFD